MLYTIGSLGSLHNAMYLPSSVNTGTIGWCLRVHRACSEGRYTYIIFSNLDNITVLLMIVTYVWKLNDLTESVPRQHTHPTAWGIITLTAYRLVNKIEVWFYKNGLSCYVTVWDINQLLGRAPSYEVNSEICLLAWYVIPYTAESGLSTNQNCIKHVSGLLSINQYTIQVLTIITNHNIWINVV